MKLAGLTRRDLLRWSALSGVGIAVGGTGAIIGACGDNVETRPPGDAHAAAILEPESDSFIVTVWAQLARAIAVDVRAANGGDLVFSRLALVDSHHAAVEVTGLEPGTSYHVTILADDGVLMGPHHVRTAPRADDPRPVRIAVSADIDPSPEFDTDLIAHLIAAAPELYVSLGDFPYTDNGPPAVDVTVYRERHAEVRTEPRVRRLLEAVGMRAIYDDHEFRNDWDSMYAVTEASRYAAAMQVWDEFFPIRGGGEIKYRRWRWGAHLECFLLDCRRYRSPNAMADGPAKSMLGAVQRAWLVDGVRASTATFKVVFTSVPLDFGDGIDHWSGFLDERNAILGALTGVPGLLFVSADQHMFAAHQHVHGVREFQVGPLSRGIGTPVVDAAGVLFRAPRLNAGIIDVDGETLTFSALGVGGEIFYQQSLSIADLTPSSAARR